MLLQATVLDALYFLADTLMHLLVLSPDLFARTGRKMAGDDPIVWSIELSKLDNNFCTSISLT